MVMTQSSSVPPRGIRRRQPPDPAAEVKTSLEALARELREIRARRAKWYAAPAPMTSPRIRQHGRLTIASPKDG